MKRKRSSLLEVVGFLAGSFIVIWLLDGCVKKKKGRDLIVVS